MNIGFYEKLLVILSSGEMKFRGRLIPQVINLSSFQTHCGNHSTLLNGFTSLLTFYNKQNHTYLNLLKKIMIIVKLVSAIVYISHS